MSPLSRYVRNLRIRRGFSLDFAAAKAGIDIVDYLQFEEAPEKTLPEIRISIFQALDITKEEFSSFQIVAHLVFGEMPYHMVEFSENELASDSTAKLDPNVISLSGRRSLAQPTKNKVKTEC